MANEMKVEFTGVVGSDPEIKQAGDRQLLSMRIAHQAKVKKGGEYVNSETIWVDASLWERWANDRRLQNVADSITKGTRVDVVGELYAEAYTTRSGNEGVSNRMRIVKISPSMEYATAKVTKNEQSGGGQQRSGGGWAQSQPQGQSGWAQPQSQAAPPQQQTPQTQGQASFGGFDDEQPF